MKDIRFFAGIDLEKRHNIALVMLIIIASISAIFLGYGRQSQDILYAMYGLGLFCASVIVLLPVLLKKYDISFAISLLVSIYAGLIVVTISVMSIFDPYMPMLHPYFLAPLVPWALFIIVTMLLWDLYQEIFLAAKYAHIPPSVRRRSKRSTMHGMASIFIGFLGVQVSMGYPPVGMIIGGVALLLGLHARRRRDRTGLGGIILGTTALAIGFAMLIYFFTFGRHYYLPF